MTKLVLSEGQVTADSPDLGALDQEPSSRISTDRRDHLAHSHHRVQFGEVGRCDQQHNSDSRQCQHGVGTPGRSREAALINSVP
jgi:hypothetical protein